MAIKKAREAKGWTQEHLAQLVDLTPRSIMYIENRGQHPRLNKFYLITTLLNISVDQFFYPCDEAEKSNRRKQIDVLLNGMEETELIVIEATAEGLKKARETLWREAFGFTFFKCDCKAITPPFFFFLFCFFFISSP